MILASLRGVVVGTVREGINSAVRYEWEAAYTQAGKGWQRGDDSREVRGCPFNSVR